MLKYYYISILHRIDYGAPGALVVEIEEPDMRALAGRMRITTKKVLLINNKELFVTFVPGFKAVVDSDQIYTSTKISSTLKKDILRTL